MMFITFVPVPESSIVMPKKILTAYEWNNWQSERFAEFKCPNCNTNGIYLIPGLEFFGCRECLTNCDITELGSYNS